MKRDTGRYRRSFWLLPSVAMAIAATGFTMPAAQAAEPEKPFRIEIVYKDKEAHVVGYTMPGVPTEIVLRNEDTITHGFTSTLFKDVKVRLQGEGTEVKKKHFIAFHVDPGKTATLSFTKRSNPERETMYYTFWCDLHPAIKGEFLVIETTGEIGGG